MFWARWLRLSRPSFRLASAPAFFSCALGWIAPALFGAVARFNSSWRFFGLLWLSQGLLSAL